MVEHPLFIPGAKVAAAFKTIVTIIKNSSKMQNFYRIKHSNHLIKKFIVLILQPILLIIFLLQIGTPAYAADGQTINNTRITIIADNVELKDIFKLIEQKTEFIIGYDNAIDIKRHVSVNVSNKTVSEVLKQLLKDYKGTISQVDDYHVLIKVEKVPLKPKV
jgi:hypothetical protein